jgi:hypothetical protein
MTIPGSKKPQPTSPDALTKTSCEGSVELSEAQLSDASGGAVFPSGPTKAIHFKLEGGLKIDVDPAVKPGV